MPALAITTSSRPNRARAASTAALTWAESVTSVSCQAARAPSAAAPARRPGSDTPARNTLAPSAARARAVAIPIEPSPPVMSAVLPASRSMRFSCVKPPGRGCCRPGARRRPCPVGWRFPCHLACVGGKEVASREMTVLSRYMGGVRPGAGFESPAAMRHRWLAGIFAVFAAWAVAVALVSNDNVHQTWGQMAAVGYGLALAAVLLLRHSRTADIALGLAFLGGLVVPLGWLAAHGLRQPEGDVVARSAWDLIHHGTPYATPKMLAGATAPDSYNPYLPVMALFGLPRAFFNLGLLTDPRVWFGVVFIAVFWLALRHGGAPDPGPRAPLVAGRPAVA